MPKRATQPLHKKWLGLMMEKLFDLDKHHFTRISMPLSVVEDIITFAKTNHPKEFVAFLQGTITKKTLILTHLQYLPYESSEDAAVPIFQFPDHSYYGSVHSHPLRSNKPSSADIKFFRKMGIIHAIICMPYTKESLRFYNHAGEPVEVIIQ